MLVSGADESADTTDLVNAFCDCAGFYKAGAGLYDNSPATVDNLNGLARGAEFAAQYLLGQEYAKTHDKPKAFGFFSDYTEGRVETSRIRVLALMEGQDAGTFNLELEKCKALSRLQEEIVQKMRDDAIDR